MTDSPDPALLPTLPLIRTKLAPPRIGSAPVERRALLEELEQRRSRRLHLLVGPAGSGKTSLLVQWRKQLLDSGARVAWYSAGPDDDELRIASYLVETLRQAGMNIGSEGLQLFLRSGGAAWQHLLASLVNDCDDPDRETYLVIDNFQFLSSFSVLQLLNRWIALAPPSLHFVFATRVRPPLELVRLRSEDQLVELGFGQLRFDADETRRFVESQGLPTLDIAKLGNLQRITDGWAAGLQLLTFSMRNDGRGDSFLDRPEALVMNQAQALDDYLTQTVVGLLQPNEVDFLTRISICRRFNRELCEAVSGDAAAGEHLRKFEAENLFLLPLDTADDESWYRFHPLFASFLDKCLRKLGSTTAQALHRRAAQWFAQQQLQAEALRHALRSGDAELLVDLIDQYARRLTNAAQYFEYLRWCEKAPPALLAQRLGASLSLALAQLSCGRLRDFERTVAGIEQHPQATQPETQTELWLLKAYHAMRTDDPAGMQRALVEVERHPPPPHSSPDLMLTSLRCHQLMYAGRYDTAREAARLRFRGGDNRRQVVPLIDCWVGFAYLLEGEVSRAVDQLQSVAETSQKSIGADSGANGIVYGYLCEALYQSDRIDEVRRLLDQHLELIEAIGLSDSLMYAYRSRAQIERLDGDHASALKTLQDLEERGLRMGLDRIVAWSLHDQLLLALEMHELLRSEELLRRLDFLAGARPVQHGNMLDEIPLAAALARANHAVAFTPTESATPALLDRATTLSQQAGRRICEIHTRLLRAQLLLSGDQQAQAVELLREQLRLAMSLGARRLLTDLPAPVRRSLLSLAPQLNDADIAGFICNAAHAQESGADIDAAPLGTDADTSAYPTQADKLLTVREREILDLLGRALSAKSIARDLNLSPGTVKWHLRNIYGKLGAFSKEDALLKARERAAGGR